MKTKTYPIEIPDTEIIATQLLDSSPMQLLVVTQSKQVLIWNIVDANYHYINQLPEAMNIENTLAIYIHQKFVCIVEDKGSYGIVFQMDNQDYRLNLERGDYHQDHCSYPIAFYSDAGQNFLIHATDWNRLDITCLETKELLTDRLVNYEGEGEENYLDYFHSSLSIAADGKHFLSNGWVWQPYDLITIFNTAAFFETYDKGAAFLHAGDSSGYNWDRPVCWIDNQHFAVPYGIAANEDVDVTGEDPVHLFIVDATKNEVVEQFPLDGFAKNNYGEVYGQLHYDTKRKIFIGICTTNGLFVIDRYGKSILSDLLLRNYQYNLAYGVSYEFKNNFLTIKHLFDDDTLFPS